MPEHHEEGQRAASGIPTAPVAPTASTEPAPSRDWVREQAERNARYAPILPERVRWRAVVIFVVVAMGLAWVACLPLWLSGEGLGHPLFQIFAVLMMYTPTIAAAVVIVGVDRPASIPRRLGLGPLRPFGRTIGMSAATLFAFAVLPFAAVFLGAALGMIQLDLEHLSAAQAQLQQIEAQAGPGGTAGMTPQMLLLVSIAAVPINALVSSAAAFGEELGWRGWLVPNLLPLGRWPALLISGVIWALWHAPIILLGYNFGYTDARGLALMIGFCVPLGVLLGWLRLRTASVWPAVVGHGAVNTATGTTLLLLHVDAQDVQQASLGTFLGIPGWILMAAVVLLIVALGQFRKQAEPGVPWKPAHEA
ncbi:CPBP family intramembrane glutamic endopeptidase [Ruania rhizosphaerae]|uniref:CPBP family intramembrane glutamic endopeptidase n=1 Tax=Ruania rhizosphaerae TaxID=1840413 RepID=UPI001356BD58|nr:type II CAAX endopeptidase family protein [Ruania rhizosphaerae]